MPTAWYNGGTSYQDKSSAKFTVEYMPNCAVRAADGVIDCWGGAPAMPVQGWGGAAAMRDGPNWD